MVTWTNGYARRRDGESWAQHISLSTRWARDSSHLTNISKPSAATRKLLRADPSPGYVLACLDYVGKGDCRAIVVPLQGDRRRATTRVAPTMDGHDKPFRSIVGATLVVARRWGGG